MYVCVCVCISGWTDWALQELGLLGSTSYVDGLLNTTAFSAIKVFLSSALCFRDCAHPLSIHAQLYLNQDMIGMLLPH
jgi:hypothetical protein